jgi:serine/threonine-protein kinase HipA
MSNRNIDVWLNSDGQNHKIATLWSNFRNGQETFSFEYSQEWLNDKRRFAIEPLLKLSQGQFHRNKAPFGAIGDTMPDRWGRILMNRAEQLHAKNEKRPPQTLSECDYLLGVNDFVRQGALRFTEKNDEIFLHNSQKNSIPPLILLSKLLYASQKIIDKSEKEQDLQLLLEPGSSLGGARPKSSVIDINGHISIAKFPKKDDFYNVVLWEAVALTLAQKAGVNVPKFRIETVDKKNVLIIERFDRLGEKRIPFISAMTMLNANDNEEHSYLEIAYSLAQYGSNPNADKMELFKRIIFSILISNTDDHLRNHGFLYENNGWRLSPVYDINPTPRDVKAKILSTKIDYDNYSANTDIALSVCSEFSLSLAQAKEITENLEAIVKKEWRNVALRFGIKKSEIDYMASAFE